MALTERQEADELLQNEVADAWFEYLDATRGQSGHRYVEVEPWAWERLTRRRQAIKERRRRLRPASAAA